MAAVAWLFLLPAYTTLPAPKLVLHCAKSSLVAKTRKSPFFDLRPSSFRGPI
jgi:hypothetical protein